MNSGIVAEEAQQIPALVPVDVTPAAVEARDKLLAAIGAEAELVAEKSAGQASAALAELARAYALMTGGGTVAGGFAPVSSRGVYAHGFDRPSPIQPTAVVPVVE